MAEEDSFLYLPEALEEHILVRLPIKSIFRFESVCKRWYSLFRSKAFTEFYFGSGHHQVSIPTKKDLCLIYPELKLRSRRRCRQRRSMMWATGPLSNGIYALISILIKPEKEHFFLQTLKIGLFNPATQRIKFAAPFPDEYLSKLTGISSHWNGVSCGIDDDYRVVVLIFYRSGGWNCFLIFLYTWRTGDWEMIVDYNPGRKKIPPPGTTDVFATIISLPESISVCPKKLFNGCWHWLTLQWFDDDDDDVRFGVLSFDFKTKSIGVIRGPECKTNARADVFVLQDHLAVIVTPDGDGNMLQIWMKMNDPETIWINIYSVDPTTSFIPACYLRFAMFYGVECYQVQEEEPELIRVKRLTLLELLDRKLITFDDEGGHRVAEEEDDLDQIPLSIAGISTFRPTLERLPENSTIDTSDLRLHQ